MVKKTTKKKSTRSTKASGGRKKTVSRSKAAVPEHELPGGFWRQVMAVLMLVLAVVLIFGWLGDGGPVLEAADNTLMAVIGYAKYTFPVLLVWLAVKIFRSENNRLPAVMWIASVLMVFWVSGMVAGLPTEDGKSAGGFVGDWLNGVVTGILDQSVAIFIYIVLIFVTAMFILQTNPVEVFRAIGRLFHTSEKKEQAEISLPEKAEKVGVERRRKVNIVPEGEHDGELKVNLGMAENEDGKKLTKKEEKGEKVERRRLFGRKLKKTEKTKAETGAAKVGAGVAGAAAGAVAGAGAGAASVMKAGAEKAPTALVAVSDKDWKMPPLAILSNEQTKANPGNYKENAEIIKSTLADFGINVEMDGVNVGPRITQYTMRPPSGVSLTKITSHDRELALNLAVEGQIRIEAPIPGTRLVGVEVPNVKGASVGLRSILESKEWANAKSPLAFVVGKDISGKAVVADLAKMPHLLVAGTTGSGKSVMSNTLILSLLYRNSPSDLKMIMIDPKQVEMTQYEDIPHLLTPIITSVEKSLSAMKWAVNEMERRYSLMAKEKVKKIDDYNAKMAKGGKVAIKDADGNEQEHDGGKMPFIVIIVDEMADLMMQAGKDLEALIVRIAQKGRAAGIHLVLATQSPKVQVITGLIKSNVPARITFKVTNFTESSVALGMSGAEKLLGMGDMIMLTTEMAGRPRRIQSAYVDDPEILAVTDFLREQRPPDYNDDVVAQPVQIKGMGPAGGGAIGDLGRRYDSNDPVVRRAIEITLQQGKFSTASLQTWLGKGHGFVSGLAIWLEEIGVIGPANGHKPREVLIQSMEEFDQLASGGGA